MNATTERTVTSVTIEVGPCFLSQAEMDERMGEYIDRLEAAVRQLPDLHPDADVIVFSGQVTRYEGTYSDSAPHQYDAMTERLSYLAESVFAEMNAGR